MKCARDVSGIPLERLTDVNDQVDLASVEPALGLFCADLGDGLAGLAGVSGTRLRVYG
jgi:hypothetical protein